MSELKVKKGNSQAGSIQMALLHLRWQQIRQLELLQLGTEASNQEDISGLPVISHQEKVYSTA